jgi:hypothetical protein
MLIATSESRIGSGRMLLGDDSFPARICKVLDNDALSPYRPIDGE